ncbi:MAG: hypothetical protein ABFE16_11735 [Armatimonadia bacterium]
MAAPPSVCYVDRVEGQQPAAAHEMRVHFETPILGSDRLRHCVVLPVPQVYARSEESHAFMPGLHHKCDGEVIW